jgi:cytochrome c-type biogenesis protein CcmF
MRSLLGQAALSWGLAVAVGAAGWWGLAARGVPRATQHARIATVMTLAAAAGAFLVLAWALLADDFSVRYVAENGQRAVPVVFKVLSVWSALEGSLLLWLVVLTAFFVVAALRPPPRAGALHPPAMAAIAVVTVFFFALALFAGNAFQPVANPPPDGPGPNPLLQDHWLMSLHPPLLYLGYVGFTIPFAYAVAALITGQTGRVWVQLTRRWTLAAWTALTAGIILGGWWGYEVLGWGGYWAWDPVENASILPWFTATALLHSVLVQERRATLRVWNLALACATFLLVLVGTFITRSGVIGSVHAFTQSAIGPLLLGFIVAVVVAVGLLFVWRGDRLGPDDALDPVLSREIVFLANNVLLVTLALTVLIGTLFPLLAEAVAGQRLSVGAPYFNRMAVPIALVLVLLMGVGPAVSWGADDPKAVGRRLAVPAALGSATVATLGLAGLRGVWPLLTFGLAAFALAAIVERFAAGTQATRRATGRSLPGSLALAVVRRRRFYGGLVVHIGVVLAAVAIAASSSYGVEAERRLEPGDSLAAGPYTATLVDISERTSQRRDSVVATVSLERGERDLGLREARLSVYPRATQAVGTASVTTRLTDDAYLILAAVGEDRDWVTLRLAVNPLVVWLWIAGGVMVAGSLLAGLPALRRRAPPHAPAGDRAPEAVRAP